MAIDSERESIRLEIERMGFSPAAAIEIVDNCDATRALLAYRLSQDPCAGYTVLTCSARQIYSSNGYDAYLYPDGSVVFDEGQGYESAPDVATLLGATGWHRRDLSL